MFLQCLHDAGQEKYWIVELLCEAVCNVLCKGPLLTCFVDICIEIPQYLDLATFFPVQLVKLFLELFLHRRQKRVVESSRDPQKN